VIEPANQSLLYGAEARLRAQTSGDPDPDVQWQVSRDGGATWNAVAGATSPPYAFVRSGAQSGSEYRAVFTHRTGDVTTRPATLTVVKAVPTLEWQVPTPIEHGTPLSFGRLDAEASVPGTFRYTPPAGTVLAVGAGQPLTVTFTPRAERDYTGVTASVPIDVTTTPEPSPPPPPPPRPAVPIATPPLPEPTSPGALPGPGTPPTPGKQHQPAAQACGVRSSLTVIVPRRLRAGAADRVGGDRRRARSPSSSRFSPGLAGHGEPARPVPRLLLTRDPRRRAQLEGQARRSGSADALGERPRVSAGRCRHRARAPPQAILSGLGAGRAQVRLTGSRGGR